MKESHASIDAVLGDLDRSFQSKHKANRLMPAITALLVGVVGTIGSVNTIHENHEVHRFAATRGDVTRAVADRSRCVVHDVSALAMSKTAPAADGGDRSLLEITVYTGLNDPADSPSSQRARDMGVHGLPLAVGVQALNDIDPIHFATTQGHVLAAPAEVRDAGINTFVVAVPTNYSAGTTLQVRVHGEAYYSAAPAHPYESDPTFFTASADNKCGQLVRTELPARNPYAWSVAAEPNVADQIVEQTTRFEPRPAQDGGFSGDFHTSN